MTANTTDLSPDARHEGLHRFSNTRWQAGDERLLTVLVPFRDYDVAPLVEELIRQAARCAEPVALLFADDGSTHGQTRSALRRLFEDAPVACGLIHAEHNMGRARVRNLLGQSCDSRYLLFLDSDMLPDDEQFLERYAGIARLGDAAIVCGGRSYRRVRQWPREQALYREYSLRTECQPAALRQLAPYRYTFTNNLMIRRELFLARPFDAAYVGWGFEDIDWGLQLHRQIRIEHIENTATHCGLVDDAELLHKLDRSVPNFVRVLAQHPREVLDFPVTRVARWLCRLRLPAEGLARMLRWLLLRQWLPLRLRFLFLQLYRACLYAAPVRGYLRTGTGIAA